MFLCVGEKKGMCFFVCLQFFQTSQRKPRQTQTQPHLSTLSLPPEFFLTGSPLAVPLSLKTSLPSITSEFPSHFSRPVPLSSQSSGCQRLWGSNEKNLNKRERKKTIRLCRKDLFSSMTSHRPHINLSFFQCYNSTLVSSAHRIVSLSTLWGH